MDRTSAIELDFFSMENKSNGSPSVAKPPIFERRKSFRDIQGIMSKINPAIMKSVIGSTISRNPSTPKDSPTQCDPTLLRLSCGYEKNTKTSPMTIFYHGKVVAFNISPQKAQDILNVVDKQKHLEYCLNDLPITRKISLQRFLEKRRERLVEATPYNIQKK